MASLSDIRRKMELNSMALKIQEMVEEAHGKGFRFLHSYNGDGLLIEDPETHDSVQFEITINDW